jgi:hypothetical protein
MFPPIPFSLPAAFPKLFTHAPRMRWSLHSSGSIMPERRKSVDKGPSKEENICLEHLALPKGDLSVSTASSWCWRLHVATTPGISNLCHLLLKCFLILPTNLNKIPILTSCQHYRVLTKSQSTKYPTRKLRN